DRVGDIEPIAESHALQVDVAFYERRLLCQRCRVLASAVCGRAQQLAEPEEHRQGAVAGPRTNQGRDRIECVEQKVRLDLEAPRVERRENPARPESGTTAFTTARPRI